MDSFSNLDSFSLSSGSTIEYKDQRTEELTMAEERIYTILFNIAPNPDGIKVNNQMKGCLTRFEAMGLAEDPSYPKLIELGKEAIDHGFDSVEKDRLHVINEDDSSEIICRHKTRGTWEFVAVIEKSLIRTAYKNKNSGILSMGRAMNSTTAGQSLTINSKDFRLNQP